MNIDLDNINEEMVYQVFGVDGKEAEALNDSYLELFELIRGYETGGSASGRNRFCKCGKARR